jgi:hypothetical protein
LTLNVKHKRGIDLISDALPFRRLVLERYAILDLRKTLPGIFPAASTPVQ